MTIKLAIKLTNKILSQGKGEITVTNGRNS